MSGDELALVTWLQQQQRDHSRVRLGIGDDMAALSAARGATLLSSDMLLDGVHFDTTVHRPAQIGRKAIACSLSDCAAMAVRPVAATVSVALPSKQSTEQTHELFRGMFEMAHEHELAIVGGDTTRWNHPLAIDVAISAQPFEGVEPVRRSGARAGDGLFVTGPLGGSLLGRHLNFAPRVTEARCLAEWLGDRLHAMIDISDGLALDLWRICQASDVGAMLDEASLGAVISEDAHRASAADGRSPMEHALGDGEDFELLLAVAGEVHDPPVPLFPVGWITEDGLTLRKPDGTVAPLEPKGYVH